MTKQFEIRVDSNSVQLLSATIYRRGGIVYNDTDETIYISLDGPASRDNFALMLPPKSFWEIPAIHKDSVFCHAAPGVTGFVRVTSYE